MLKIKKLNLHNFMCVSDADLDFTDSKLILLIGTNGAGKSTVLTAIALCLLESKRSDSYKENIKLNEKSARVFLEAEINGKPLDIEINLSSTSSTMNRTAHYDGKSYNNSEVSELLESFDLKYYSDIIMSSQGAGDITKLSPTEREKYLQKLLNFDFSEQANTCKESLKDLNRKISYNTNQIEFSKKMITQRYNEIKTLEELDFTEADIQSLENEKTEINKKIADISNTIANRNKLSQDKANLNNELLKAKQEVARLTTTIEYAQKSVSKMDDIKKDIETTEETKKILVNEIESLKTNLAKYKDSESQISIEREKIVKENATLTSELTHNKQHLDLIDKGFCPECGHEFDATEKESYQTAYNETATKLQVTKDSLEKIDAELMASKKQSDSIQKQIDGKNSELSTVEAKISQLEKEIESIKAENVQITVNQGYLHNADNKVSGLLYDISEIDKKISEIEDSNDEYTKLHQDLSKVQQQISDYSNRLSQYNMVLKNNEDINKNIAELNKTIQDSEKLIADYRAQYTTYDEAQKIFDKALPQYLILKTCNLLENDMNNFIHIIFPEMGVYLFPSKNGKGVEFYYTPDLTSLPKDFTKENLINVKMSSGFEKAAISIAFKVCLCKAYGLAFAFMDEIDEAGTDENSELLFRSILTNDLFNQLFIISHKPMVRDVIQNLATNSVTYYVKHGAFSLED